MNVQSVSYKGAGASAKFTESLRQTGFGVLTDHPIPAGLVTAVFQDWTDFFASEQKHRYKFDPKDQAGYFPFRTENAKDSPVKDLKEFFHLYPWNQLPEGVSTRTRELFDRLSTLAGELLGWIEENTPEEIRRDFDVPLQQSIERSQEILLRPIHYPPLTGGEEEGAIRAAAHEDINLITLLPAATAPGLEVLDTAGRWHEVPCDPGSIVVNNGDMLQMATRGLYRSTTHRVVNPHGPGAKLPRYSMPLFLHPRSEVRLSEKHTAGSYLKERLEEIGLLKKGEEKAKRAG
jgi:isopenicillin N synthase-like dioxygenase